MLKINNKSTAGLVCFMGHGTASDLFEKYDEGLKDSDRTKLIQVSLDSPSVNCTFYEKVEKSQEEAELLKLFNIGSCSLHVVDGALKTGLILCFLQHLIFATFLFAF